MSSSPLPVIYSRYTIIPGQGFESLKIVQAPVDQPKQGEVLIAVKACSLNYRDILIANGWYPATLLETLTPASDGAGEVVAIGENVTKWKIGDRVMGTFTQAQISGPLNSRNYFDSQLGGPIEGMLAQYKILPDYAWNSLFGAGSQAIGPGQTAVFLGTGGVSVWGAQLALLAGARVIITSSSDSKLEIVRKHLGDHAGLHALERVHSINYSAFPDWHKKVLELTDGIGADQVLEVTGSTTLEKSFGALKVGGLINQIGMVPGQTVNQPNVPMLAIMSAATLRGIYVGSRKQLEDLGQALTLSGLRPLITKVFDFSQAKAAYQTQFDGGIIGKVVIKV